ncbi:P-loop containing nucleoside triphosphate hydrolase protein [Clavulina sp. PMI_390]|nr:P-loop containing nucleoside triphosphate hydrolase protein [Clavulina sp. PMI_390]
MESSVSVHSLTYSHTPVSPPSLRDVSIDLPKGSRTLIIGANGAGKSTLLQILAGKRMTHGSHVVVLGKDTFRNTPEGIVYLGTEWAMNPVVRSDIVVSRFLDSVGGYRHKERRDRLLDILDVDLDWHMHAISDGERRRVQLTMGLMQPWDVLLLDEVTVDLDVLVRSDLLKFLTEESVTRGATILYATHIFDGLDEFPTHISHMRNGEFVKDPVSWPLAASDAPELGSSTGSDLHKIALAWLKEDRELRRAAEKAGDLKKTRGARVETTDSEAFYKKYDYSH